MCVCVCVCVCVRARSTCDSFPFAVELPLLVLLQQYFGVNFSYCWFGFFPRVTRTLYVTLELFLL